jgi:hypothetical protein
MKTSTYLWIAVALIGGIAVGIAARGFSDAKGYTTP